MAPEGGQRGASTFQGLYLSFRPLAAPGRGGECGPEAASFQRPPSTFSAGTRSPGVGDWNSPVDAP